MQAANLYSCHTSACHMLMCTQPYCPALALALHFQRRSEDSEEIILGTELLHMGLAQTVVPAVRVQGQPLLGQVRVVRHQEASLGSHIGAGHEVWCVGALVVVGVNPPAQQVAVL